MRFIDEVTIDVTAGKGGPGAISFMRQKYKPRGRPDGGDGGRGGSIILRVTGSMGSLMDYRFKRHFEAGNGQAGSQLDCSGRSAEDMFLPVPRGTLVFDQNTNRLLADLSAENQEVVIAKGGRGGKGNAFFCSSTNQSPRFSQPGEEGEVLSLRLELKLLADVGLVGMPNAGKSSLITALTAARPKVADYPFTTLNPQLGVVKGAGNTTFVMADIPGLIEGASQGAGLGHEFLRHVERSRLLLHLVDVSEMATVEPVHAFEVISKELEGHHADLATKPRWVVLTKMDITTPETIAVLRKAFESKGLRVFPVSSASRDGLKDLVNACSEWLQTHDDVDYRPWKKDESVASPSSEAPSIPSTMAT